ncbi:MAG: hypothetical protein QI223_07155 [Candidatus Korarchaeota archaeon]|nr:hypothetical protein [Candidatus Korarchaeota archaeon]
MPNLTVSLPEDLRRRMRAHPEIRWSEVVRRAIEEYLDRLELVEEEPIVSLADRVRELEGYDPEADKPTAGERDVADDLERARVNRLEELER